MSAAVSSNDGKNIKVVYFSPTLTRKSRPRKSMGDATESGTERAFKKKVEAKIRNIKKRRATEDVVHLAEEDAQPDPSSSDKESEFDNAIRYLTELSKKKNATTLASSLDRDASASKNQDNLPIVPAICASSSSSRLAANEDSDENSDGVMHPSVVPEPVAYQVDDTIPYGCLKGGIKPSYKSMTRRIRPTATSFADPHSQGFVMHTLNSAHPVNDAPPKIVMASPVLHVNGDPPEIVAESVVGKLKSIKKIRMSLRNLRTQKRRAVPSVSEMRMYLCRNGLIKVDSAAPAGVLKQMYISAQEIGDVSNRNPTSLWNAVNAMTRRDDATTSTL